MLPNIETIDPNFNWNDSNYILIEYQGNIESQMSKFPNARLIIVDRSRAVLVVLGDLSEVIKGLGGYISNVELNALYSPCETSPGNAAGADLFHTSPYLQLDGTGTIIGILDSGIDYLNEEFINEDGSTRILAMLDQGGRREYTSEDINNAIKAKNQGLDPYSIVPLRDDQGHGTYMASIAGARGVNPEVIGVAPKCYFAIVKLAIADERTKSEYAVVGDSPVYTTVALILGMRYLYEVAVRYNMPMVILIPLGSNTGPKDGLSTTERFMDEISAARGITFVTPTGNQGDGENHASGELRNVGDVSEIELKVDSNQRNIWMEVWVKNPDKFTLSIVSPTGEIIQRVPPIPNRQTEVSFLYEGTRMVIEYLLPERQTGDERIIIKATNIKEGIWKFRLLGELVVTGRYDAYLVSRQLLAPETKFLKPDPYVTLSTPSTATQTITVAAYNQSNNSIVGLSGRGYTRDGKIKPDIAAGGVNALVASVGGGTQTITGTSVAAAVTAGCCSLIYEWGIVEGNDPSLYSPKLKTYLIRGTEKRLGDTYPNREWGYGMLNLKGVFDNIRFLGSENRKRKNNKDRDGYYVGSLFVRLP
jgi:subtilisin family serine protease